MILGDSLLVMNSLAEKEGFKGKVPDLARTVHFEGDTMHVVLDDGRDICVVISSFPWLQAADARERGHWRLIGGGIGIHWEDIDEDLSVAALVKQADRTKSPIRRP